MFRHFLGAALLAAFTAAPALAQEDDPADHAYLESLRKCRDLTDPTARLACYDAAANRILTASEKGLVRVVEREEFEQTRRRLFGFSLPGLGIFGGDRDAGEDEQLDMLESTVTSARRVGDDWVFTIAEGGAAWRISNPPMRLDGLKAGDKVVFKKAALGSYFVRINGQTGVKGMRIR